MFIYFCFDPLGSSTTVRLVEGKVSFDSFSPRVKGKRYMIPDTEKSSNQPFRKLGNSRPAWALRDPVSDQINEPNIRKKERRGQMGGGSLRITLKPLELYGNSIQLLVLRNRNGSVPAGQ